MKHELYLHVDTFLGTNCYFYILADLIIAVSTVSIRLRNIRKTLLYSKIYVKKVLIYVLKIWVLQWSSMRILLKLHFL